MKKTISIILVAALMTGFAACGSDEKHEEATTAAAPADSTSMPADHSATEAAPADTASTPH